MRFGDIVVAVDATRDGHTRLQVGLALAARSGARLVGFYVSPTEGLLTETVSFGPWPIAGELVNTSIPAAEIGERIRDEFETGLKQQGLHGDWLLGDVAADLHGLLKHGRCADLIIAGLTVAPSDLLQPDIERLVVGSGRPVLGIPPGDIPDNIGKAVTIAWDASRAASRAVHDAIPFLEDAESIRIVTITGPHYPMDTADDLQAHLRRLGLTASVDIDRGLHVESPAEEILTRLKWPQANLLVAGGFGHSRFSEHLFGGATRTFLHQMMVPVLVSH
jgi:nucleotide-binding universal stress UspA family protein